MQWKYLILFTKFQNFFQFVVFFNAPIFASPVEEVWVDARCNVNVYLLTLDLPPCCTVSYWRWKSLNISLSVRGEHLLKTLYLTLLQKLGYFTKEGEDEFQGGEGKGGLCLHPTASRANLVHLFSGDGHLCM